VLSAQQKIRMRRVVKAEPASRGGADVFLVDWQIGEAMEDVVRQFVARRAERRERVRLRTVFDASFKMLEPFFAPEKGWVGLPLQHLSFRVVRENFPELTHEEVHSLVISLHRAYIDRYPECSDHLLRPDELRRPAVPSPS